MTTEERHTAHTRNQHDDGYDIATGRDLASGKVVGRIFWDGSDPNNTGLVIAWNDDDEQGPFEMPDDADEAIAIIEAQGYDLDADSKHDIAVLASLSL